MKKQKQNLRDINPKEHQGEHSHDDGHDHDHGDGSSFKIYL